MKTETSSFLGDVIKQLRLVNQISQNDLSLILGFKNGQYISNIERGLCSLPFKNIPLLAKVLKVDESAVIDTIMEDVKKNIESVCSKNKVDVVPEIKVNPNVRAIITPRVVPIKRIPNYRDFMYE